MILKYKQFLSEKVLLNPTETPEFGASYYSNFIGDDRDFFEIKNEYGENIGEIEYGKVDDNTIEIISIYINPKYRGKNYGLDAYKELLNKLENPNVILKAAKSSKGFWKKLGFQEMSGYRDYFKSYNSDSIY